MQKELDDEFVHSRAFEERQGFAHQTLEALAQCVFEAFDGVSRAFEIRSLVLSSGQDVMIAFQMINDRCTSGLDGKRVGYGSKAAKPWHRCAAPGRRPRFGGYVDRGPIIARRPYAAAGEQRSIFHPVPQVHRQRPAPRFPPSAACSGLFSARRSPCYATRQRPGSAPRRLLRSA